MSTFADRHIGTTLETQRTMLDALGISDADAPVETLMRSAVPAAIFTEAEVSSSIPHAATEAEALAELRGFASRNTVNRPMIGLGYYGTITPSVIQRNVLENPSWYTAYTPYQPEISQGRLEALINFQTMVADLTGLSTANASMLDESTAVAEGMLLARRASKSKSNVFVVDADAFPQTKALLSTRAAALGIELVERDLSGREALPEELFGVFVQYPAASGLVWDPSAVIDAAHVAGGLAVVAADLLALTLISSPGSL
ncbi:MAG TPA: glycine dehydrogenase (aminomethyl-transferring), partial [Microbacterium sp.]|nr:glycine dehydrogenase (aminomethyl-transferring) [Microbacterium sp.]